MPRGRIELPTPRFSVGSRASGVVHHGLSLSGDSNRDSANVCRYPRLFALVAVRIAVNLWSVGAAFSRPRPILLQPENLAQALPGGPAQPAVLVYLAPGEGPQRAAERKIRLRVAHQPDRGAVEQSTFHRARPRIQSRTGCCVFHRRRTRHEHIVPATRLGRALGRSTRTPARG